MWQRQNRNSEPLTLAEARYKAAAYCSTTEHCPQEVREKLRAWGAPQEDWDEVIDYLIDENFISEERYCRAFVGDKIRYQGWGKEKIRQALAAKRLPACLIQSALEEFPEEEYLAVLRKLYERKAKDLKGEDEESFRGKMARFLLGRGFRFQDINQLPLHLSE